MFTDSRSSENSWIDRASHLTPERSISGSIRGWWKILEIGAIHQLEGKDFFIFRSRKFLGRRQRGWGLRWRVELFKLYWSRDLWVSHGNDSDPIRPFLISGSSWDLFLKSWWGHRSKYLFNTLLLIELQNSYLCLIDNKIRDLKG